MRPTVQTPVFLKDPVTDEPLVDPVIINHPDIAPVIYNRTTIIAAVNNGELLQFGINNENYKNFIIADQVTQSLSLLIKEHPNGTIPLQKIKKSYFCPIQQDFPEDTSILLTVDGHVYSAYYLFRTFKYFQEKRSPYNRNLIDIDTDIVKHPFHEQLLEYLKRNPSPTNTYINISNAIKNPYPTDITTIYIDQSLLKKATIPILLLIMMLSFFGSARIFLYASNTYLASTLLISSMIFYTRRACSLTKHTILASFTNIILRPEENFALVFYIFSTVASLIVSILLLAFKLFATNDQIFFKENLIILLNIPLIQLNLHILDFIYLGMCFNQLIKKINIKNIIASAFHLYLFYYTITIILEPCKDSILFLLISNPLLVLPLILNAGHVLHSTIDLINEGKNAIWNFKNADGELSLLATFHQFNKFFLASGMGMLFYHCFNSYTAFLTAFFGIFADDAIANAADRDRKKIDLKSRYTLYGIRNIPIFSKEEININTLSSPITMNVQENRNQ